VGSAFGQLAAQSSSASSFTAGAFGFLTWVNALRHLSDLVVTGRQEGYPRVYLQTKRPRKCGLLFYVFPSSSASRFTASSKCRKL
jgi:hypothetical protein